MDNIMIKIKDKICSLRDLAAVMGVQGKIETIQIFCLGESGQVQTWEMANGNLTYKLEN